MVQGGGLQAKPAGVGAQTQKPEWAPEQPNEQSRPGRQLLWLGQGRPLLEHHPATEDQGGQQGENYNHSKLTDAGSIRGPGMRVIRVPPSESSSLSEQLLRQPTIGGAASKSGK
jgi:hypothetical protein